MVAGVTPPAAPMQPPGRPRHPPPRLRCRRVQLSLRRRVTLLGGARSGRPDRHGVPRVQPAPRASSSRRRADG